MYIDLLFQTSWVLDQDFDLVVVLADFSLDFDFGSKVIFIKYLPLIRALLASLMLLLICAYCFLSRLALLSFCSRFETLLFKCSTDIASRSFGALRLALTSFSSLSFLSICSCCSFSLWILSNKIFFKLSFSLNSSPYLDRAVNPLFLFSELLLIKKRCSSISLPFCWKRLSFSSLSLFNSALNFSWSGFGNNFFGASGTGVSRVISLLFQLYCCRFYLSRRGFFYFSCLGSLPYST